MNGTAMGTKFAPSFANLYMGAYEDIYIMGQHAWRDCIVKYKCYIDDLLFVWRGTENDFQDFTNYPNSYDWGLTLSGEISSTSINYLHLNLSNLGSKIVAKNYFKVVDCNSLLDYHNNHHRNWLKKHSFWPVPKTPM